MLCYAESCVVLAARMRTHPPRCYCKACYINAVEAEVESLRDAAGTMLVEDVIDRLDRLVAMGRDDGKEWGRCVDCGQLMSPCEQRSRENLEITVFDDIPVFDIVCARCARAH